MHNIETWWWINHKVTKLMESKKIYVTVIYYYTKYIKVINHGKITYPPNIFLTIFIVFINHIIISSSVGHFFWKFRFAGHKIRTAGLYKHMTYRTYVY